MTYDKSFLLALLYLYQVTSRFRKGQLITECGDSKGKCNPMLRN
jgi:hypothetical protein